MSCAVAGKLLEFDLNTLTSKINSGIFTTDVELWTPGTVLSSDPVANLRMKNAAHCAVPATTHAWKGWCSPN